MSQRIGSNNGGPVVSGAKKLANVQEARKVKQIVKPKRKG